MKKRLFSLMLAVLFVLTAVPITSFADESQEDTDNPYMTRFTVDTVNIGNDDETVQINIRVDVNNGFAGMTYQLVYDSNVLSLKKQPTLGDIDGFDFVPGPLDGDGRHIGQLFSAQNVKDTGILLTYTFSINPDAKTGTYEIQLITDGKAQTQNGVQKLEVIDEDGAPVVNIPQSGGVVVPGYKITYDANGGSGAPAVQTKSKNDSVRISSTLPVKDGYICRGWATSSSATRPQYEAGSWYSENADLLLYAVWEKLAVTAGSIDIAVVDAEGKAGGEVEVAISIANHPGVGMIQFNVIFDDTKLDYLSAETVTHPRIEEEDRENTINDFEIPFPPADTGLNKVSVVLNPGIANVIDSGEVVKLKFKVLDDVEDGFTDISIVPVDVFKYTGSNMDETPLQTNVINGKVEISSQLVGDINLDETVNSDDAVLLLQHLLFGETIFPIEYSGTLDFNKDGNENSDDAVRLLQYALFGDVLFPIE